MNLKITASKTTHRHELRIRVDFQYNAQATALLRQIPDTRWSRTMKCWHVPYTKEAFEQLKELFPELEYESSSPTNFSNNWRSNDERNTNIEVQKATPTKIELNQQSAEMPDPKNFIPKQTKERIDKSAITITIYPKIIEIKIPKDEADIQFIRSFKYAKWNSNQFCWTVPNKLSESEFTELYNLQNNKIHY